MDFLLVNEMAAGKLIGAGIDAAYRGRDKPSDHAPAWITLSIATEGDSDPDDYRSAAEGLS